MYSKECDSLSVQLLSLESEDGINALEVEVECEEVSSISMQEQHNVLTHNNINIFLHVSCTCTYRLKHARL